MSREREPSAPARRAAEDAARLLPPDASHVERGAVRVCGETVRFELRAVDTRTNAQRVEDERRGAPAGHIIVVVPGHAQTVSGPKNLLAAAALLSRSKIAWCIDPVPARGGDCTEAQAIAATARHKIEQLFPGGVGDGRLAAQATVVGWSHGGSEALRAAAEDPALFPQFLGLCPTGLTERKAAEMVWSFGREALQILWAGAWRRDWPRVRDTSRLGLDLSVGLVRDLRRCRSLKRLIDDVTWACRKVPGEDFHYPGQVVVLWSRDDRVVRWRDVFSECDRPESIGAALPRFAYDNLPHAAGVQVRVLDGDHVSPETAAPSYLRVGLGLLDQLGA